MKKLMIAAAIVCAAACSQATSFTWGNASFEINNWNGDAAIDPDLGVPMYKDGKMYLYLGTVGYTAGEGFDLSSAKLITSGGYDGAQFVYGNADASAYSTSSDVNKMGGEAYTLILTEGGKTLAGMADGDHFVMRSGTSVSNYDGVLEDFAAEFVDYDPIAASSWQTFSTPTPEPPTPSPSPEPTSGLLLLLGVAGLALRRKQA